MDYKIIETLGIISTNKYGWSRELNVIQFDGDDVPMYEIREWSPEHKMSGEGIILSQQEAEAIASLIVEKFLADKDEPKQKKVTVIDFKTREKKPTTEEIEFPF